jgi:hypothetical protein
VRYDIYIHIYMTLGGKWLKHNILASVDDHRDIPSDDTYIFTF